MGSILERLEKKLWDLDSLNRERLEEICLDAHPITVRDLEMEFHSVLCNQTPIERDEPDSFTAFIFGIKTRIRYNRYATKGDLILFPNEEIIYVRSGSNILSRYGYDDRVKVVPKSSNWKERVKVIIMEKVESFINNSTDQMRMKEREKFLRAKRVPIRIINDGRDFHIGVNEDEMNRYFFSEGVNNESIQKAGNYAKKVFNRWLDNYVSNVKETELMKETLKMGLVIQDPAKDEELIKNAFGVGRTSNDLIDSMAMAVMAKQRWEDNSK